MESADTNIFEHDVIAHTERERFATETNVHICYNKIDAILKGDEHNLELILT